MKVAFLTKPRVTADRENNSIIVNQKLVKDFGWNEGVGKTITLYDTTTLRIIGVLEDFYMSGVWEAIEPAMLRLSGSDQFNVLAVRANPEDLPGVLDFISEKWKAQGTNQIFGGRLQEDLMQEEKDINGSILKVNLFLAVVATLLSLIGMFNLVSLDIIRRTKEVGIRKIQGASCSCDNVPYKQKVPDCSCYCFIARMRRRILFVSFTYGQHLGLFCHEWVRVSYFQQP